MNILGRRGGSKKNLRSNITYVFVKLIDVGQSWKLLLMKKPFFSIYCHPRRMDLSRFFIYFHVRARGGGPKTSQNLGSIGRSGWIFWGGGGGSKKNLRSNITYVFVKLIDVGQSWKLFLMKKPFFSIVDHPQRMDFSGFRSRSTQWHNPFLKNNSLDCLNIIQNGA